MEIQHAGGSQLISSDASTLVVDTPPSRGNERFAVLRATAPLVVPSLLLCDFGHLADEIAKLEEAGVQAFHLDVMDGQFVPNLTYGMPIVEAVRRATNLPIEAHLMIARPAQFAADFIRAGADMITFHVEAVDDPRPLVDQVHALGASAGLAFNPDTPLSAVLPFIDGCDLVLVMSVSPGFGGQAFQTVALEKLRQLRGHAPATTLLEVDGGVNAETISQCAEAGAQLFVAGSAIFNHDPYGQSVTRLTHLAKAHSRTR